MVLSPSAQSPVFWKPPVTTAPGGGERVVGVELEFAGLDMAGIAEIITGVYGGRLETKDVWSGKVCGTSLAEFGDFAIELDASLLKDGKLERYLGKVGVEKGETFSSVEDFVARSARHIVPMEIVAPPLPLGRLPELERLRAALAASAAKDTRASVFHAFGTHFNPEAPSFEAADIRDILRAFLILYDWLKEKLEVDLSRRLTPFIDPFPRAYARLVLAPDYAPDLDTLIRDYLRHNPTRNRPLDMLPLFAHLREDVVFEGFEPKLVSPRPAYHYRLPNCSLNDPAWTLASEWNRWVVVERVAADKERMAHLAESWLHWLDHPAQVVAGRIAAKIREWFA
ncbi:MAG: amidoligase family protein [Opitutales bacterium]|nr:amidoligase family protein [Opitutales bacterium]